MKKLFSVLAVACMAVLAFTSCEKKTADPVDYPIVGKIFYCDLGEGSSVQLQFHNDFTVTMTTVLPAGTTPLEYDWAMKNNVVDLKLQKATYYPMIDKEYPKGFVLYSGPYDAAKKTLTMKDNIEGGGATIVFEQKN